MTYFLMLLPSAHLGLACPALLFSPSGRTYRYFSSIAFVTMLVLPVLSFADNRDKQSGEINMQLEDDREKDPYMETKESVIKKLTDFEANLQAQSFSTPPIFNKEELTFLATIHLYCTLQDGVCTLVPFSLYETDLVRAAYQDPSKISCPNLTRFWKQWISADMEKRVALNLKVVHFEKRNLFKKELRPKLLRCSNTVSEMLSKAGDKNSFLKQRYTENSEKANLAGNLVKYIVKLHEKIKNIYRETGVRG